VAPVFVCNKYNRPYEKYATNFNPLEILPGTYAKTACGKRIGAMRGRQIPKVLCALAAEMRKMQLLKKGAGPMVSEEKTEFLFDRECCWAHGR